MQFVSRKVKILVEIEIKDIVDENVDPATFLNQRAADIVDVVSRQCYTMDSPALYTSHSHSPYQMVISDKTMPDPKVAIIMAEQTSWD